MSLRAIERELGIHRATIKKYMEPTVLQGGVPGRLSLLKHLIQWRGFVA